MKRIIINTNQSKFISFISRRYLLFDKVLTRTHSLRFIFSEIEKNKKMWREFK